MLLLIAKHSIVLYSMIKKNVIKIIDTADTSLLRESAKLVFIYKNSFVLSTTYQLAKPAST